MNDITDKNNSDTTTVKVQKRKYSRNGCVQCKKRRMKCDEIKPKCWQCDRLNRECVYILNMKNKKRKPKGPKPDEGSNLDRDNTPQILVIDGGSSNSGGPINGQNIPVVDQFSSSTFGFSFSDANLLFNNLNDLVSWRLEEALTPGLKSYMKDESQPFNTKFNNYLPNTADLNEIVFNNPITNFNLGSPHNRYLERFYNEFCDLVSPFVPRAGFNPVRDVLLHYAKRETYLMYAILACGAQSLHQSNRSIQDDQAYCSYLSSCINILGEHFNNENSLTSYNVEPMLLTILLLTSDCASSKNLKWRTHLKGAKLLLQKTTIQSDTLNFCKNWLMTYEVLAGLTNPFGGIFQNDENELNNFITNDKLYLTSLRRLNMLEINDFNYLSGHMIKLDLVFRDIINILNKIRKARQENLIPNGKSPLDDDMNPKIVSFDEINKIMVELTECEQMFVIDKSGEITESNLNHPSHNNLFKNFNNIDSIALSTGETVTKSWFDIAHQAHLIVARLILLTKILEISKYSVLIQDLVKKALNFIRFINFIDVENYKNKCATHLHLMIDIVGRCCIYEEDQLLTAKYLNLLNSFGLASATFNLQKLKKIWNNEAEEEEDILTW